MGVRRVARVSVEAQANAAMQAARVPLFPSPEPTLPGQQDHSESDLIHPVTAMTPHALKPVDLHPHEQPPRLTRTQQSLQTPMLRADREVRMPDPAALVLIEPQQPLIQRLRVVQLPQERVVFVVVPDGFFADGAADAREGGFEVVEADDDGADGARADAAEGGGFCDGFDDCYRGF